LKEAARFFSILAEPARLRILQLLREGRRCGRELARDLNLTPATTCHHLEKLKLANLLSEQRSGKHVYYSLSDSELTRALEQSLATLGKDSSRESGITQPRNAKMESPERNTKKRGE
jgi:DNA-binding transcriptional ArsR family regulator